jgi:pre-mRNA-splicing factor SYF1
LCENALEQCPPKFAKPLYFLYAKIEEDYGLAKNAMRIYDRALSIVPPETLNDIFVVYIAKATSFFGLAATREIYQKALEILPDIHAKQMAVKFSQLEIKLGEVDRARAIYAYASQFCNPNADEDYWQVWHTFEVKYGNEDTYREMLR